MREETLPSPDIGGKGYHLRRIAANAISQLEIAASAYGNGRHPAGIPLAAFFTACATAATALAAVAPTLAFAPTAKTYSIAAGPTVGPTLGGAPGATVRYTSATPARATVDPVTGFVTGVSAGTSVITATVIAAGGYLAATQTYIATVTA